jgi:glutathione reductase (NADPH)
VDPKRGSSISPLEQQIRRARRIFGAHLVGPHADETINIFALAIRHGLTADDLKRTTFAYPTGASDIGSML